MDQETQDIVRQMMADDQRQRVAKDARPHCVEPRDMPEAPACDRPVSEAVDRRPERDSHRDDHRNDPGNDQGKYIPMLRDLTDRIRGYRPGPKAVAWTLVAVVMLLRPWLISVLILLTVWIVLITYFTLGPDRVADLTGAGWERFEARRPEAASRILTRVHQFADRADGWLARLPERWTDGIYLPDLGRSQVSDGTRPDLPDPFDRLARENLHSQAEARRA